MQSGSSSARVGGTLRFQSKNRGVMGVDVRVLGGTNDTIHSCKFFGILCKDMLEIKLERKGREEAAKIWKRIKRARDILR